MRLKVRLEDGAPLPKHAHAGDAGLDLTTRETVKLYPGDTVVVGTGVSCEIPDGYFGLVAPRSGLASKHFITLANAPSVIDSGYRGEIKLALHNFGCHADHIYTVERGERCAQMVLVPYASVECVESELSETERGSDGFGSTGSK